MVRLFDIWRNTETGEYGVREMTSEIASDDDAPEGFNKHIARVRAESKRRALVSFLESTEKKEKENSCLN